jgi:DNA-binding GntR family transcriptional regulator
MDVFEAVEAIGPGNSKTPDAIYEYLRGLILNGGLEPQSVISQVKLAEVLGVSRTPLREAMRRLQQEGLIESEHNRRARVIAFDPEDLEWVYTNRLLYEPLGVALTVPRMTNDDLAGLDKCLADMRRTAKARDYGKWEDAHHRFHRALVQHADIQLLRVIDSYADRGNRYRRMYQSAIPRAWAVGDLEHESIVAACHDGDTQEAVRQLARHFGRTAISLVGRMMPEYDPVAVRAALVLVTGQVPSKR